MRALRHGKQLALEIIGWLLVVAGIAALVLPGPGLLMLFGGLALLSQRYEWARRRVEPVKDAAQRSAAQGVQSWWRIALSLLGVAGLVATGVFWGIGPAAPSWWPLPDSWWLLGGWGTGVTLIVSALIALGLLIWSWRAYRGRDMDEIEREIERS